MTDFPICIDRHGNGNIGRFCWVNSDTRRTCSSWTFWGDWWWDTRGERPWEREGREWLFGALRGVEVAA